VPVRNHSEVVRFDADIALEAARSTVDGTLFSCCEYDSTRYRPLYVAVEALSMYRDRDHFRDHFEDHFEEIHNHVHMERGRFWPSNRTNRPNRSSRPSSGSWRRTPPRRGDRRRPSGEAEP